MRPDVRTHALDVDRVAELLNAPPRSGDVEVHRPAPVPVSADGALLATSVTDRQQLADLLDFGDVEVCAVLAVRIKPRETPRPPVKGTITRRQVVRPALQPATTRKPAPKSATKSATTRKTTPAAAIEPTRQKVRRHRRRRRRAPVILGAIAAEISLFAAAATTGYVFAAAITTALMFVACVVGTLVVIAVVGPMLLSIVTGARCPCPCTCC